MNYSPKKYLFEKTDNIPMAENWPSSVINKVIPKTSITKYVHCHTFRHTFAVILLEHGVNLRNIQLWLGHKRLETTAIYLRIVPIQPNNEYLLPLNLIFQKPR